MGEARSRGTFEERRQETFAARRRKLNTGRRFGEAPRFGGVVEMERAWMIDRAHKRAAARRRALIGSRHQRRRFIARGAGAP